jgi:hypothetical protein
VIEIQGQEVSEMKRTLHLFAAAALVTAPVVAPDMSVAAQKGGSLDFCTAGANCVTLNAQNTASVTVQSVKVRQLPNSTAGCLAEEKRHTANLRGGSYGDWFEIEANKACDYKITFVTSDGCTGDKTATLTTTLVADGYVVAIMNQACGSLATKPRMTRYRYPKGEK